jgi:hypothetical protein
MEVSYTSSSGEKALLHSCCDSLRDSGLKWRFHKPHMGLQHIWTYFKDLQASSRYTDGDFNPQGVCVEVQELVFAENSKQKTFSGPRILVSASRLAALSAHVNMDLIPISMGWICATEASRVNTMHRAISVLSRNVCAGRHAPVLFSQHVW